MIKDYTISKKIGDKYIGMITLKEGWKLGFSPSFKKELVTWLKDPQENWLNFNLKEWDAKPEEQSEHDKAKANGYQKQAEPIDDEIPF